MNKKWLWLGVPVCSLLVLVPAGAAPPPTPPTPGPDVVVVNGPDDPVPVTGSLEVGGTVNVGNLPAVQTVAGTVSVGNLPAVQNVAGTVTVGNAVQVANNGAPLLVQEVRRPFQFHYADRKEADVIFGCRSLDLPPGQDFVLESVSAAKNQLNDLDLDLLYLEFHVAGDDFSSSPRVRLHIPLTTTPFGTGSDVNDQSGHLETQILVRPQAELEDAAFGDVWQIDACIGRNIDAADEGQHGVQLFLDGSYL